MPTTPIRRSRLTARVVCILLGCLLLGAVRAVAAPSRVSISGLADVDEFYQLTSPDDEADGADGLSYRRLDLTADAPISDAISVRSRVEASPSILGSKGRTPFVKDPHLTWKVGGGHVLLIGVTPSPAFVVAEGVWGGWNPEKITADLSGAITLGGLRYGVRVGDDDSGVLPVGDGYRRVGGRVGDSPEESLAITLASNDAAFAGSSVLPPARAGIRPPAQAELLPHLLASGSDAVDTASAIGRVPLTVPC